MKFEEKRVDILENEHLSGLENYRRTGGQHKRSMRFFMERFMKLEVMNLKGSQVPWLCAFLWFLLLQSNAQL